MGALLVIPKLPPVKNWRADTLAKESLRALEAGDAAMAQRKARAAYQLRPHRLEPLRAAAQLSLAAGDTSSLTFFRRLVALEGANDEDRLGLARAALAAGEVEEARTILLRIAETADAAPEAQSLLGRLALNAGKPEEALIHFGRALEMEPTARRQLEMAAMQLRVGDEHAREKSVQSLLDLATEHPQLAEQALFVIAEEENLTSSVRLAALEELAGLPGESFERSLHIAELKIKIAPEHAQQTIKSLAHTPRSPAERTELARLLVRNKLNQEALEILPLEIARTHADSLLVWLDAAAGLGLWSDILEIVRSPDCPLEDPLAMLYQGRALEELGTPASASAAYAAAARLPCKNPEFLFYIAGYLLQRGFLEDSEFAIRRLLYAPDTSRLAAESLLNILRARGDTPSLAEHLQFMRLRWPNDLAVRNDLAYVDLLLERNVAEAHAVAAGLVKNHPEMFAPKITLALALVKTGKDSEALRMFRDSEVRLDQLLPFQRAIFAGVLKENALPSVSAQIVATLSESAPLLPEEKHFAGIVK